MGQSHRLLLSCDSTLDQWLQKQSRSQTTARFRSFILFLPFCILKGRGPDMQEEGMCPRVDSKARFQRSRQARSKLQRLDIKNQLSEAMARLEEAPDDERHAHVVRILDLMQQGDAFNSRVESSNPVFCHLLGVLQKMDFADSRGSLDLVFRLLIQMGDKRKHRTRFTWIYVAKHQAPYFLKAGNVIGLKVKGEYRLPDISASFLANAIDVYTHPSTSTLEKRGKWLGEILRYQLVTDATQPDFNFLSYFRVHHLLWLEILVVLLVDYALFLTPPDEDPDSEHLRQQQQQQGEEERQRMTDICTFGIHQILWSVGSVRLDDIKRYWLQRSLVVNSDLSGRESVDEAVEAAVRRIPLLRTRLDRKVNSLKHSCRLRIRGVLYTNWRLPDAIYTLHIPHYLKLYLDLQCD